MLRGLVARPGGARLRELMCYVLQYKRLKATTAVKQSHRIQHVQRTLKLSTIRGRSHTHTNPSQTPPSAGVERMAAYAGIGKRGVIALAICALCGHGLVQPWLTTGVNLAHGSVRAVQGW